MNKTYSQMKTNVGEDVQDTSATFASKIGRYLNDRYFQLLDKLNWSAVRTDYTFNTVAGTQDYVLPDDFFKEKYVYDSTNRVEIGASNLQNLIRLYAGNLNGSGAVGKYCILDKTVKAQPSAAGVVSIVSNSSSDSTQTILIRGIVDNAETTEDISANGTTAATGSKLFSRILGVSKNAIATGKITVTIGSTTIAVILPQLYETRYKVMRLYAIPSGIVTLSVPYIMKAQPLYDDNDYTVIDCSDIIEIGAKADAWRYKRQFAKAQHYEYLFELRFQDMLWSNNNKSNEIVQFLPQPYSRDTV